MNTVVTSKEEILKTSRELIRQRGWSAVNIRSVAIACGVSVGSIYNYFHSKSDLAAASVESIWKDIFHFSGSEPDFCDFTNCIRWVFDCMKKGEEKYPGFFTLHSMILLEEDRKNGQRLMHQAWGHIRDTLYTILMKDKKIHPKAFNEKLTREQFIDFIFSLILAALIRQDYDDSAILEIIKRSIYS